MLLEVGEVFITADDIINGNAFGHRQEIEVFRVADVGLGFYGNIGDEADIMSLFMLECENCLVSLQPIRYGALRPSGVLNDYIVPCKRVLKKNGNLFGGYGEKL